MLLAVEEQVFAMLADALLKQTNRKKTRKGKNQTTIPSSVCVFIKRKTLSCMFTSTENGCTVEHALFKLHIFHKETQKNP